MDLLLLPVAARNIVDWRQWADIESASRGEDAEEGRCQSKNAAL
jgi:hypothetical protein